MGVLKTWTGAAWEEIEFSAMTVSASDVADLTPIPATTQSGTTYTLDALRRIQRWCYCAQCCAGDRHSAHEC